MVLSIHHPNLITFLTGQTFIDAFGEMLKWSQHAQLYKYNVELKVKATTTGCRVEATSASLDCVGSTDREIHLSSYLAFTGSAPLRAYSSEAGAKTEDEGYQVCLVKGWRLSKCPWQSVWSSTHQTIISQTEDILNFILCIYCSNGAKCGRIKE